MTNTLTRLLLTAALCGLFLLSEAQERNAVSAPDPAAPRMPADSISRDYRLDGVLPRRWKASPKDGSGC